jgi:hypothetical protein
MVKLRPLPVKLNLKPLPPHAPARLQVPSPRAPHLILPGALRSPTPTLQVLLPQGADEGNLEVVVVVRQNGATLAEGTLHHPKPARGAVGHLAIEIRNR